MKCSRMRFRIEGRSSSIINHNINLKMNQVLQHQDHTTPELQGMVLLLFLRGLPKLQHKRKMPRHNEKTPHVTIPVRRNSSPNHSRKKMKARKRDLQLGQCRRVTTRPQEPTNVKKTRRQRLNQEECHRRGELGEQGLLLVSQARRWRTLPASPALRSQVCVPMRRQ